MHFNRLENLGVSIKIVDRDQALRRRWLRSTQATNYEGSNINIDSLADPSYKSFFLTLSQTIYLETESGINCRNYPNNEFESFQECDEYFVYNKMKNHHKIMPFWAAKTLDEVTTLTHYHFDQSNYTTSPYYGIISGIDESNCPLPCKLTKVLLLIKKEIVKFSYNPDILLYDTFRFLEVKYPNAEKPRPIFL